jgi:hypothetical protein
VPKFGDAAIAAVQMVTSGVERHAPDAWRAAVHCVFPDSDSSRTKGCPRGAFLGLCEEGFVKGVPGGSYTRSKLNKQYALDAVLLLRKRPALVSDPGTLWQQVVGGAEKVHNSQMDVVVTLWSQGFVA